MVTESKKYLSKELAEQNFLAALRQGEYVGGQPIKESVLARQLGLARTGVREMLTQAIYWGVVEYVPYSGFRIRTFSLRDTLDWCVMREALEPAAARCFAEHRPAAIIAELEACQKRLELLRCEDSPETWHCDVRFHTLVVQYCGNRELEQFHQRIYSVAQLYHNGLLGSITDFYRLPEIKDQVGGTEQTLQEFRRFGNEKRIASHLMMLDALKTGDGERAEYLFRGHLHETVTKIRKMIEHEASLPARKRKNGRPTAAAPPAGRRSL